MNLEKLNVVEMNSQEIKETEGGLIWFVVIGACLLLSGCGCAAARDPR